MDAARTELITIKRDLRCIVANWESLRVLYNLSLLIFCGSFSAICTDFSRVSGKNYLAAVVCYGIAANIMFFFGPLIEFYIFALGIKIGNYRLVIFAIGWLFSLLITLFGILIFSIDLD